MEPARPLRVWPAVIVAALYWAFRVTVAQLDLAMFPRFLSNVLSNAAFLLAFLILWAANGTVRGRTRLLGAGLLVGGAAAGAALADRSFDPLGYVMTAVPYALTTWTAWMIVGRVRPAMACRISLSAALLLPFIAVDLLRWEGLDARLRPSFSWRWSATAEQVFLSAKVPAAVRPTRPWTPAPGDWPEFRGPRRDGAVPGVRAASRWTGAPPLLWKRSVGPGWSSVIVVDAFLVTQEQRGDSEAIVCYDAETGAEQWCHLEPGRFSESLAGPGPRATPAFRDGRIYALGGAGRLTCLDAPTGSRIWSRDLAREAEAPPPQWGFSSSPLVAEGKVLAFIGGPKSRGLLALDAATGATLWSREGQESYSSPQLAAPGGAPQVLMHDTRRLAGIALADGAVLWERPWENATVIPMLQPQLLRDGTILAAWGHGIALLDLKQDRGKWTVAERWTSKALKPSFNDFVVHEGHAYGLDNGILGCVNLANGERVWKRGRYGGGQILLLPDASLLVVLSEQGELALVEARPRDPGDGPRYPALEGKTWNHPVVVRDRLYVRNGAEMACFRLPAP